MFRTDLFQQSERLNEAAKGKDLSDKSARSCTTGFDNDGSTGFEIFENGFRLALQAAITGSKPWLVLTDDCPPIAHFFLGTEEEVLEQISKCDCSWCEDKRDNRSEP